MTQVNEKEIPLLGEGWKGWVRITDGSNRRYQTPNGQNISNAQFTKIKSEFPTGFVPDGVLQGIAETARTKTAGFFASITRSNSGNTSTKSRNTNTDTNTEDNTEAGIIENLDLPEPKPHTGRPGGGRASPKELSDGLYISISIATSIVALLLREPQLAAKDLEAKNIAIPAANLLAKSKLNERFGRLIAESGDWQLLGYAIWMYFNRVFDVVKVKRGNSGPQSNAPRTSQSNVPNTPASPNGAGSAPGGFISNGAKSPPGVTTTTFIRQ